MKYDSQNIDSYWKGMMNTYGSLPFFHSTLCVLVIFYNKIVLNVFIKSLEQRF